MRIIIIIGIEDVNAVNGRDFISGSFDVEDVNRFNDPWGPSNSDHPVSVDLLIALAVIRVIIDTLWVEIGVSAHIEVIEKWVM